MSPSKSIVLGTNNAKKRAELVRLLGDTDFEVLALSDFDPVEEAEETGSTFSENAAIKATYYATKLNQWVIAEDSGLSVAALDGAPGVYSARFSGPDATDEKNNQLLLEKLKGVPRQKRNAWYTCHIALSDPQGNIHARTEDYCHGVILSEPSGDGGFGYDPLFEIPEYDMTFAVLGPSVKSVLSHRGRAYRKFLPMLLHATQVNETANA